MTERFVRTEPRQIEALRQRRTPLDMSPAAFREAGHRLIDELADHLAAVPRGPVARDETPERLRQVIDAGQPLPASGADAGGLLSDAASRLFGHALFNGHPRFFGYITSSPAPIGMFADLLAAALNQNMGAWKLGPLATEIEAQTMRWIAELIGYPQSGGGILVSGGNMANWVCLLAARRAKAAWNIRQQGVAAGPRLLLYASAETHTWIQKAADLCGLGTDAIRWIAADAEQRMDVAALQAQLEQDRRDGHQPFLVVGTAGSVSTGAVDPLTELAAICKEQRSGFTSMAPTGRWRQRIGGAGGAERAGGRRFRRRRSAQVALHAARSWLRAGARRGAAARRIFIPPALLPLRRRRDELRGLRAAKFARLPRAKVWLGLRQAGRDGCLEMIEDDMALARHLHRLVEADPEFEATSQSLSITTFRYVPRDLSSQGGSDAVATHLDDLNQQLLTLVERSGEAFLSNAIVGGRFVLRACVVNFHTALADIEALPPLLSRLGRQADFASRPASLRNGDTI